MASTFPDQVQAAAKWSKKNPNLKGDEAVKRASAQPWDPSVQSLVAFPQVLATLSQQPSWVKQLGEAFLSHPEAVMDSVQRLRKLAQDAGQLKSDEHQQVAVEQVAPEQTVIRIEPTQAGVVYVPSYNPQVVYGAWPYPAYPPTYLPPPYGYGIAAGVATGLAFGVGVGVTRALWGGFNWGHHDVNINTNRYNNINTNRQLSANQNSWRRNNQARINNARANTGYRQTRGGAAAQGRGAQRARAQQAVQRRQPGAYGGTAQQRAQRAQTSTRAQGQRAQGAGRQPGGQRTQGVSRSSGAQRSQGVSRSAPSQQRSSRPQGAARGGRGGRR
jgi:hypothetical protein